MAFSIAVGIPTVGRASVLCETLREFSRQTRLPDAVFVCGSVAGDLAGVEAELPTAVRLLSAPGLPRQRNAILAAAAAAGATIVVFFDDDFVPHPTYLAGIEHAMRDDPSIVVATGLVVADGIGGPGLSFDTAHRLLADAPPDAAGVVPAFTGYGCNMAVRLAPIQAHGVWFDERLPLYGWQEDVDFSRRLGVHGRIVQVNAARGVHLGVKVGRSSGVRLGYSQIANPLYLSRKRLGYPLRRALFHIARNVGMNCVRLARPEPYVDRAGRLRGNLLALRDLVAGRMRPERILEL